jgi:hypothetical protein
MARLREKPRLILTAAFRPIHNVKQRRALILAPARLTCVCKVGRQVVLDGEAPVKVPREEKGKRRVMRL